MTRPSLNEDQKEAVKAISAFIIGPDKEFFMTGGPGVGKTFTTRELSEALPTIMANYNKAMGKSDARKQLVMTSTTNKAAAVLTSQTGIQAQTIHSFLGLIPKQNFKTGRTMLTKTPKWEVHSNKLIFIDEASMIEHNLYNLIQEATDPTCKIIYIGDKNQLPPVMEKLSPAVDLANKQGLHYEITTPVRNAEAPALLDLCQRLKQDIINETPKSNLTHWKSVPGQTIHINGVELESLISSMYGIGGSIKAEDKEIACRILAYTNKTVIGYNQHIRQIRGLPSHPVPGEILICNTHFQIGRSIAFNVEDEILIHKVEEPEKVFIDQYNDLTVRKVEVSSPYSGRRIVDVPESNDEYTLLLKHYRSRKDWKHFYHLQESFMDLRTREAATVYKAQGSTYESVIMIMDDIFTSKDENQLRRMLYVGASRARKKVYVYDKGIHENRRGIYA